MGVPQRPAIRVPVTISVDTSAQTRYIMDNRTWNTHAEVSAIAASGAKSNLRSMTDFLACRFSCNGLPPVSHGLSATNCSPISIEGALFAKFTTKFHNDEVTSCCSMVHVSSSVEAMYLSTTCYSTLASSPRTFHHTRHSNTDTLTQ